MLIGGHLKNFFEVKEESSRQTKVASTINIKEDYIMGNSEYWDFVKEEVSTIGAFFYKFLIDQKRSILIDFLS